jgi:iron complex outermembrane receptor protein
MYKTKLFPRLLAGSPGASLFVLRALRTGALFVVSTQPIAGWAQAQADVEEPLTELQAFIAEEVAAEDSDSLLPTDRTVSSVFFEDMTLGEIPRSVVVLSPEAMRLFQIEDFSDLGKVGAGTDRYNFYGIAGSPVVRGWIGGSFFNGMLRAYQRNSMPTSFGSLEALNVVKGPAPAQYIPTHVGGYVDMLPKSPYFDAFRGSFELEAHSTGTVRAQLDVGAPLLLGDSPAAYRISITGQAGDSYYDVVRNDYLSVYAALKVKLSDRTRLFAGAEFYRFKSNENAGWNRPTQALLDDGLYVVGSPLSLVRSGSPEYADRNLIDAFTYGYASLDSGRQQDFRALVVPNSLIDEAVVDGEVTVAQRALLKDMRDPAVRAATYAGLDADIQQTTEGYLYTADYFQAGGKVFTAPLDGAEVLADARDFADSEDFMGFLDLTHEVNDRLTLENKFFAETLETDKRSSYGYSFRSAQDLVDNRLSLSYDFDGGSWWDLAITTGVEARYAEATQLEDYWTEPFARRDLSTGEIPANSVLLSGAQTDSLVGGNNYWNGGGPATGIEPNAVESELLQLGTFAAAALDLTEKFTLLVSARAEGAHFEAGVPREALNGGPAPDRQDGRTAYTSVSLNPVFKLTQDFSLYAALQESTTFHPTQGGAVIGKQNFGEGELVETGAKWSLFDDRLFVTAAWYQWEQTAFSDRAGITAPYRSRGFELEATWQLTDAVTVIASYSDRETRRLAPLEFRTMPFSLVDPTGQGNDEIGVALESGALLNQFSDAFGGFSVEGGVPTNNERLVVPGAPEQSVKLFAVWEVGGGFTLSGGAVYRGAFWHNFDHTLRHDDAVVVNANVGYQTPSGRWEILLSVENLTDTDYFLGAEPDFGANTLVTKAPGVEGSLTVKMAF